MGKVWNRNVSDEVNMSRRFACSYHAVVPFWEFVETKADCGLSVDGIDLDGCDM